MARSFTEMTRSFQVCFPKTFSLTEDQFSGKTYFYTIGPCRTVMVPLVTLSSTVTLFALILR